MTSPRAPLVLFDTFTGQKRPLTLLEAGKVGVYNCGPTTYDLAHIGHARAAIAPDLLVRFLKQQGLEVRYVRNVTDIDDKIIQRAHERGEDPAILSQHYTHEYRSDMRALGMLPPTVEPKVTEHVTQIVALVERLIANGLAYPVDGDVYYRVGSFADYGKLSRRNLEDMRAGARVEVDGRKEDPADFALWKAAKAGEPAWESPWGPGRPGWHIECSAMSSAHLGITFDVHTGGRDLIFPHHENEIAQSQGAYGPGTFARHWMHNGFVNFAGEKMSKSLGNFFTVQEVLSLYHPEVVRWFMLQVHYRSGINFEVEVPCPGCGADVPKEAQEQGRCAQCGYAADAETWRGRVRFPGLEEADQRVAYIYDTLGKLDELLATATMPPPGPVAPAVEGMLSAFIAAMADDLNTPEAIASFSEPLAEVNRLLQSAKGVDKQVRLRTLARFRADFEVVARVLGSFERNPIEYLVERRDQRAKRIGLDVARVESVLQARNDARRSKNFAQADALRQELTDMGVNVRDTPDGQSLWTV